MQTAPMEWGEEVARLIECAPRSDAMQDVADAELIDLIAMTERGKGALSAVQAHAEVAFRASQVERQRGEDVPRRLLGRGVGDQIALARRITPKQASDQLALRRVLVETMPRTISLLEQGEISEWAAHEVSKNVLVLDDEDRDVVDREIAESLPTLTASRAGHVTRARAQELDPAAAVKRAERAVSQRRVSLRPAPDGMSILRAVLPTKEGVACLKALTFESKSAKGLGDPRGKGQIMADTLVERVTGAQSVDEIPVEINLLMTDTTLLSDDDQTAWMDGHPLPGQAARQVALGVIKGDTDAPRGCSAQDPADSTSATEVQNTATEGEVGPEMEQNSGAEAESTEETNTDAEYAEQKCDEVKGPERPVNDSVSAQHSHEAGESAPGQAGGGAAGETPVAIAPTESDHTSPPEDPAAPYKTPAGPEDPAHRDAPTADGNDSSEDHGEAQRPKALDVIEGARWIRRLYTDPRSGELTSVDPRRRLFRGATRRFILLRDQTCRTPWCDAAIHDVDHATRHADGGETTASNGIGHCQRFNLAKEVPGWNSSVGSAADGDPSTLTITTPTGHQYTSVAPSLRAVDGQAGTAIAVEGAADLAPLSDPGTEGDPLGETTDEGPPEDVIGKGPFEEVEPRAG